MKRKSKILIAITTLFLASLTFMLSKPASLDFSNDEEPFRSIVMPPKQVLGDGYGGSVVIYVTVTDQTSKRYEITFPIDYHGIRNAHPTAYHGNINDPKMVLLKNPERARAIAIQLLKDYGTPNTHPLTGDYDGTQVALTALTNPPQAVAYRAFEKVKNFFE